MKKMVGYFKTNSSSVLFIGYKIKLEVWYNSFQNNYFIG